MKKISGILLLFFIAIASFTSGQSIEKIIQTAPNPPKLVNDYANILTADQRQALERKLYQFDDSTSSQIVVVIVPSLEGRDVADAALDIGRNWGVGGKKNNNGVVLLICTDPKNHKLNISPGYGLEKSLPDLTCQQIIQNVIVPNFKGNDYYRGIEEGTDAIIQATQGEYKAPENYNRRGGNNFGLGKIIFFIIIIIVIIAIRAGGGGGGGGSMFSRRGAMPFIIGNILGGMGSGRGGGSFGGGGGSSGGGFGGFGGGSFGGGGSSGSW